ncbi:hypothetical protein KEM52_001083 [Ascosphaera acerosa]|nr:hypothetical protein KEM52_001083 [Ascosphaera acerosa]
MWAISNQGFVYWVRDQEIACTSLWVLATWPKPNYVNPEYIGNQLIVIGVVFGVISIITVSLRLYVRLWMKRNAGWDDLLIAIALVLVVVDTVANILGTVKFGWGYHMWDINPSKKPALLFESWLAEILFVSSMTFVHLSLLASYLRIGTSRIFRRITWFTIVIQILWSIAFLLTGFLTCIPLRHEWGPEYPQGCISEAGRTLSGGISNVFMDAAILILPIPTLLHVQLPFKERLCLVILMSVGAVACVAGIVRTYYMWICIAESYDITWWGYNTWLWVIVEMNLAVTCASVPTLRPLYHRIVVQGLRSISSGRGAAGKYEMSTADEFVMSPRGRKDHNVSQIRQMTTIQIEEEYGHDPSFVTSRLESGTLDGHNAFRQPKE